MADEPHLDDASAIADRRPLPTTSESDGIRLLDRLARLFGADREVEKDSDTSLFLWGPLEVRRSLGAGSFGEVYAAWDPTLRREVALKLRSPEVGALRWLDEARNLARIRHTNVLTVHGADVLDGRAGIWTERIDGRTLEDELIASGPFAESEVARIGSDIASALAAVHDAGLLHGDVKTSNIMLESGEAPRRAVLVDFGSADTTAAEGEIPAYVMGTPLTMAPEVLEGKPASASSDVYGLGATLFRLLTGRYPFEADSLDELRKAHASRESFRVRAVAPHVSVRLARALERALEVDPARRWPNALALRRALDDVADPTRRIRTRAAAIGAAAAALTAIAVVAFLIARPGPSPIARATLSTPRVPNLLAPSWQHAADRSRQGWGWVAAVLDLDGDGFDDVVGGEPEWVDEDGAKRGRLHVYRGGPNGVSAQSSAIRVGDTGRSRIGAPLASAGDVNGDGFDDLLVVDLTTPFSDALARARLFLGGPGASLNESTWSKTGQSQQSGLGNSMTSAGDVNHDGFGDVLIAEYGARDSLDREGLVYLYTGSPAGLSEQPAWTGRGSQALAELGGTTMRRAGDVNGDGFDDILVSAAYWDASSVDCGQIRLYSGNASGASEEPVWAFEGANANAYMGHCVAGAFDVNHDGYADIIAGEPKYNDEKRPERGRAVIFYGGRDGPSTTPDWQVRGAAAYMHFGYTVCGLRDIDGDGFDEVVVGSSQYSDGKSTHLGAAEVFRGGPGGCETTPSWRVVGDRNDAHLGQLIWCGDMNGDHITDLLVGAPMWGDSIPERGLLVTYLGQRQPK